MCVGDAQDAQDDAVRASASGRNFFFRDELVNKELGCHRIRLKI